MMVISCKLIHVFYTILTTGVDYEGQKMLSDMPHREDKGCLEIAKKLQTGSVHQKVLWAGV